VTYQGNKFVHRSDPNSYLLLSKCMDLMDLGTEKLEGPCGDVLLLCGIGFYRVVTLSERPSQTALHEYQRSAYLLLSSRIC